MSDPVGCNRCARPAAYAGTGAFAGIYLCREHWLEPFTKGGTVSDQREDEIRAAIEAAWVAESALANASCGDKTYFGACANAFSQSLRTLYDLGVAHSSSALEREREARARLEKALRQIRREVEPGGVTNARHSRIHKIANDALLPEPTEEGTR